MRFSRGNSIEVVPGEAPSPVRGAFLKIYLAHLGSVRDQWVVVYSSSFTVDTYPSHDSMDHCMCKVDYCHTDDTTLESCSDFSLSQASRFTLHT